MTLVIARVLDPPLRKTLLPDFRLVRKFLARAKRKSPFHILHGFLDGNILCGSYQHMKMVGHNDELVKQEAPFLRVILQDLDEEPRHPLRLKNPPPILRGRSDEESANFLRSVRHANSRG